MENFTFYNPTKVIFGKNTIKEIGIEIKKNNIKKVLLLSGSGSIKKNGVYHETIESLKSSEIEWIEFWGVHPNPILSHAVEAVKIVKENQVGAILAVGGGSVIDEAKSVSVGAYVSDLWKVFEKKVPIENALPVFTILTLSGTCSEMDSFAVLTNEMEKKKWNIGSNLIFPKVSIIDPEVQMSLPWNQTVNGAIDAMSHIMEFYFIGNDEESSLSICEALLKTIIKCVDNLSINKDDYNSRANLAWSATLALNGVAGAGLKGGDWGVHRIEHGISALYPDVAHGAGLGVIYPSWIKYSESKNPELYKRWAKNVWNSDSVSIALELMKEKFNSWGAPVKLRNFGISEDKLIDISKNALLFGNVGVSPKLNETEIVEILESAY